MVANAILQKELRIAQSRPKDVDQRLGEADIIQFYAALAVLVKQHCDDFIRLKSNDDDVSKHTIHLLGLDMINVQNSYSRFGQSGALWHDEEAEVIINLANASSAIFLTSTPSSLSLRLASALHVRRSRTRRGWGWKTT